MRVTPKLFWRSCSPHWRRWTCQPARIQSVILWRARGTEGATQAKYCEKHEEVVGGKHQRATAMLQCWGVVITGSGDKGGVVGSSRCWQRTRKSEKESQKTGKPHRPPGKQAAVSQCAVSGDARHLQDLAFLWACSQGGRASHKQPQWCHQKHMFWKSLTMCIWRWEEVEWGTLWTSVYPRRASACKARGRQPNLFNCLVYRVRS